MQKRGFGEIVRCVSCGKVTVKDGTVLHFCRRCGIRFKFEII